MNHFWEVAWEKYEWYIVRSHMNCIFGFFFVRTRLQDAESKTPLHVAVYNLQSSIINLLLCHPAIDVSLMERDKTGLTPFATALTRRNDKAAKAILQKLPSSAEQVSHKWRDVAREP